MKKVCIFLSLILGIALFWQISFSYNLSQNDEDILDLTLEKVFDAVDTRDDISPEQVVDYIDYALEHRSLSERQITLLEIIADEIEYEYEIGYYSDDFEALSPEDCYSDEYYDSEDQMCYYDDQDYEEDDAEYSGSYEGSNHGDHDDHESAEILATYMIQGDTITLVSGQEAHTHQEVWNSFTQMIPLSQRTDFKLYSIIDDAQGDTAAYVEQDSEDHKKWNMTVNLDSVLENSTVGEEGKATLIHEFAHVLTFGPDQIKYYPQTDNEVLLERFAENCQTNLVQEGCLNEDAYIDDFIDIFWSDSEYLEKVRNEEVSAYSDNPESFVTDYAATNPGEDIAESFTYYVLRPLPADNTIADKKLRFFTSYPELVQLRKQIRSRLDK